jgi:HSP20 family molecular chaperone IbpA
MEKIAAVEKEVALLMIKAEHKARREALSRLRAAASCAIWRGLLRESSERDVLLRNVRRNVERYAYEVGMLGESGFKMLCTLDSVDADGDDKVRAARKALVMRVKSMLALTDAARASATRLSAFVAARIVGPLTPTATTPTKLGAPEASRTSDVTTTVDEGVEAMQCDNGCGVNGGDGDADEDNNGGEGGDGESEGDESGDSESDGGESDDDGEGDDDEDDDNDKMDADYSDTGASQTPSRWMSSQPSQSSPAPQRVMPSRWRPVMRKREIPGGVQVLVDLPGATGEGDVGFEVDGRRIIIRGTLPHYGNFEEFVDVGAGFDLNNATARMLREGILCVTLPETRSFPRRQRNQYNRHVYQPQPMLPSRGYYGCGGLPFAEPPRHMHRWPMAFF